MKCHSGDDTRMIMIDTTVDFNEFVKRLQDKFGYKSKVRCRVRDEDGEGMIGLADQEDLDMVISTAKKNAKRERSDTGKLEVCIRLPIHLCDIILISRILGVGCGNIMQCHIDNCHFDLCHLHVI